MQRMRTARRKYRHHFQIRFPLHRWLAMGDRKKYRQSMLSALPTADLDGSRGLIAPEACAPGTGFAAHLSPPVSAPNSSLSPEPACNTMSDLPEQLREGRRETEEMSHGALPRSFASRGHT